MKRNLLRDKDVQAGLIVLLFAIAGYFYTNATVSTSNKLVASGISADFYPKLLFLVLGVCGIALQFCGVLGVRDFRDNDGALGLETGRRGLDN